MSMNMVSPHGQKLCDISFLDFVSHWGCFWARGLCLDIFVIYFQGCLPLRQVMSMNMVSPHGQKLFDASFLDFVSHWCCVWSGGWCLERFVIYFQMCPGVSALKIGHVNEHGQTPWAKNV